MRAKQAAIGGKVIGHGSPVYVIAEIGMNHGGDVALAARMVAAAARAGADAVKFQSFSAAGLVLDSVPHFELIKTAELSARDHDDLAAVARDNNVHFLSTPFDPRQADVLDRAGGGVPAFKIASMDLTNLPLLRHVAAKGKPVILATGMGSLTEISEAVDTVRQAGCEQLVLMHCMSAYPTELRDAHIATIPYLREVFGVPVGWSDHVLGGVAALGAVALGASVIEKHFTIDKSLPGPDHRLSADVDEMTALVRDIRTLAECLGTPAALRARPDGASAHAFRRGIYAASDIPAGTVLTAELLKCVRPETELHPRDLPLLIGRKARVAIPRNSPVSWSVV